MMRKILIFVLFSLFAVLFSFGCAGSRRQSLPQQPLPQPVFSTLMQDVQRPYVELFEVSPKLNYSTQQIEQMREYFEETKSYCQGVYEQRTQDFDRELRRAQGELMQVGGRADNEQRRDMHCDIQNLRILRARSQVLATQGLPVAYENRLAKLELIQKWPSEYKKIQQDLRTGAYRSRRWANVQDIGFRVIEEGQEDDVKLGMEAISQLRRSGMMPPEVEDASVRGYVSNLAEKIAKNSDLTVPVRVTVLNSKEINAFALPGGFLFIQRGLLEAAANESELAGVMSHEIAHAVGRHGHRLVRKAQIANLIFQAARVAGAIAGGPAGSALRLGTVGLGFALNLNLLGKSRNFELEADQLGLQYAWKSGYDPYGFLYFFDRMASQKGYVSGASWFRTHPPFYERMVNVQREILYLQTPDRRASQRDDDFLAMQSALKKVPLPIEAPQDRFATYVRTEDCAPPEETAVDTRIQPLEEVCRVPESR